MPSAVVGLLADALLVLHFAIAAFISSGFLLVPLGAALGWRWVRLRHLRQAHLFAIAFVAAEALLGIACPLTVWEDLLRGGAPAQAGFVQRWLGRLLYWDMPANFFTALYVAAALAALALWRLVPPQPRRGRR